MGERAISREEHVITRPDDASGNGAGQPWRIGGAGVDCGATPGSKTRNDRAVGETDGQSPDRTGVGGDCESAIALILSLMDDN
jgi:hypothetical protein